MASSPMLWPAVFLMISLGCETPSKQPLSLGGDFDKGWSWQGCKEEAISLSYVGAEFGVLCTWQREEGALTRIRRESFWKGGRRFLVMEELADRSGSFADGRIYPSGKRFYRIMDFFAPRQRGYSGARSQDHSELEIIEDGKVVCVYSSKESAHVHEDRLWQVPKDAVLMRGVPCREVLERLEQGPPVM